MNLHTSQALCPDLIGTWKLLHHHAWLPNEPSNKTFPTGTGAQAIIMYAPDGYMSAQFLPSNQEDTVKNIGNQAQATTSLSSDAYMAYSGEYYIEDDVEGGLIVSHYARITNVPNLSGVTQKRRMKIDHRADGRKVLTLESVAPIQLKGENRIHEVVLEQFPDNSGKHMCLPRN